jgi:hypothetical protein
MSASSVVADIRLPGIGSLNWALILSMSSCVLSFVMNQ